MMRILYDHQAFSLQNVGGISVYYYELASRLSRSPRVSVEVHLGLHNSIYPFEQLKEDGHTRIVARKSRMSPGIRRYAANEAFTSLTAIVGGRYDIYHSTLYRRMPAVRARVAVATNHDCTQERFPQYFHDPGRVIRAKASLYRHADMILCVSHISQRDVLKFYDVDETRTRVVNQGVSKLHRDPVAACEFVARLRRPYLLYVGARHPYKNFGGLIEAYSDGGFATDYDLVVVGGGDFNTAETSEISLRGLANSVLHWGYATDAILAEAYSRASLLVSPSFYEGFGLPPLEALTLGCPVLASNSGSVPEICGDAAMYFDPNHPGDLARGLSDALNTPNDEAQRQRGQERAARYSWQKNADETLATYQELIGR